MLRPSGGFLKKIFGPRGSSNTEGKGGAVSNLFKRKKPAEQPATASTGRAMQRSKMMPKERMMGRMMSRRSEREA